MVLSLYKACNGQHKCSFLLAFFLYNIHFSPPQLAIVDSVDDGEDEEGIDQGRRYRAPTSLKENKVGVLVGAQ